MVEIVRALQVVRPGPGDQDLLGAARIEPGQIAPATVMLDQDVAVGSRAAQGLGIGEAGKDLPPLGLGIKNAYVAITRRYPEAPLGHQEIRDLNPVLLSPGRAMDVEA